jgi:hypothetical protein
MTYSEVASLLEINDEESEVEEAVIDALSSGLLDVKLDQRAHTVTFEYAAYLFCFESRLLSSSLLLFLGLVCSLSFSIDARLHAVLIPRVGRL